MKRILLGAMIFFAVMAPVTAQKVTKSTTINTASKTGKTSLPKESEAYKKGFETGIRILEKKDLDKILRTSPYTGNDAVDWQNGVKKGFEMSQTAYRKGLNDGQNATAPIVKVIPNSFSEQDKLVASVLNKIPTEYRVVPIPYLKGHCDGWKKMEEKADSEGFNAAKTSTREFREADIPAVYVNHKGAYKKGFMRQWDSMDAEIRKEGLAAGKVYTYYFETRSGPARYDFESTTIPETYGYFTMHYCPTTDPVFAAHYKKYNEGFNEGLKVALDAYNAGYRERFTSKTMRDTLPAAYSSSKQAYEYGFKDSSKRAEDAYDIGLKRGLEGDSNFSWGRYTDDFRSVFEYFNMDANEGYEFGKAIYDSTVTEGSEYGIALCVEKEFAVWKDSYITATPEYVREYELDALYKSKVKFSYTELRSTGDRFYNYGLDDGKNGSDSKQSLYVPPEYQYDYSPRYRAGYYEGLSKSQGAYNAGYKKGASPSTTSDVLRRPFSTDDDFLLYSNYPKRYEQGFHDGFASKPVQQQTQTTQTSTGTQVDLSKAYDDGVAAGVIGLTKTPASNPYSSNATAKQRYLEGYTNGYNRTLSAYTKGYQYGILNGQVTAAVKVNTIRRNSDSTVSGLSALASLTAPSSAAADGITAPYTEGSDNYKKFQKAYTAGYKRTLDVYRIYYKLGIEHHQSNNSSNGHYEKRPTSGYPTDLVPSGVPVSSDALNNIYSDAHWHGWLESEDALLQGYIQGNAARHAQNDGRTYTLKVPAKYSTGLLRDSFNIGYNDSLNN